MLNDLYTPETNKTYVNYTSIKISMYVFGNDKNKQKIGLLRLKADLDMVKMKNHQGHWKS